MLNIYKNQKGSALLISVVLLVALIGLGAYFYQQSKSSSSNEVMMEDKDNSIVEENSNVMMEDKTDTADQNNDNEVMMENKIDVVIEKESDSMMEDNSVDSGDKMMAQGSYIDYSASAYEAAQGKTRVLFFHAKWCPTCKIANEDFNSNLDKIPQNVVLFKVDYDSEKALKEKYSITYQHTFVLVDDNGQAIKKWSGGGTDELISNIK